jgi:hypothetical protein
MAYTPKKLMTPAQLTGSAATYYTSPTNGRTVIKKMTFSNNDSSARTVTVYLIASGGSAGVTNILTIAKSLAASETWECTEAEGHIIGGGDFIQALADVTAKVTMHLSGVEMT